MGYHTEFKGRFEVSRVLTNEEWEYIRKFNNTRRMKRDVSKLYELFKGKGGNPFLPYEETYGNEGEYFVGGSGYGGQDRDDTIIDYNQPPGLITQGADEDFQTYIERENEQIKSGLCQPSLWCQWTVDDEGYYLIWDNGEKFYNYVEWLKYLINHFFSKWGVILNGKVQYQGEENGDVGIIVVKNNEVSVLTFQDFLDGVRV
jgi:hypothetical protein